MSNNPQTFFPTPAMLARIKDEWENGDLTADQIAEMVGTTRCIILGLAHRRYWEPRVEGTRRTLFTRLDAIHAKFDAAVK